jgi:hypothetical protein
VEVRRFAALGYVDLKMLGDKGPAFDATAKTFVRQAHEENVGRAIGLDSESKGDPPI